MTVDQAVKQNPDERYYIGFSSGWTFIGDREEYDSIFDEISKCAKKTMKARYDFARYRQDYLKNAKPPEDLEEKKIPEWERMRDEELAMVTQTAGYLEKELANWKPLKRRKVKEIFQKDVESGTAIVAEGCETGKFWFYDEWRQGYEKGEYKKIGINVRWNQND